MDYAGWELERQRRALAALLLGGGAEEAERDADRRSPETAWERAGAAGQTAAGTPGRYAVRPGGPEGRGTLREDPGDPGARKPETPTSAWERVLEASAGRDRTADAPPGVGTALGEDAPGASDRETEARAAARGGYRQEAGRDPEDLLRREAGDEAARALQRTLVPAENGADPLLRGGGFPEAGGARRGTGGDWVPVSRGAGPAAGLSPAGGTVPPWGGPGEAALRGEDSARAVSLAVQRDARRYDGGFVIY